LEQVPLVAVEIAEHRDHAVRFGARLLEKLHAARAERGVVARQEIVGARKRNTRPPDWWPTAASSV